MRTTALLALLLLSSSCIKQTPPIRLNEPSSVAIAYVVDSDESRAVSAAPEEVMAAVEAELTKRNIVPTRIPHSQVAAAFEGQRDSARRYAHLKTVAGSAPLVLLVELKAGFFSQLSGQYRWRVFGRVSAGKTAEAIDANTDSFEKPVFLQFDHLRGREALVSAASEIAERVGVIFDGFLAPSGSATTATSAASTPLRASGGIGLVYFVMVDRFSNGDPSNDGEIDLKDPDAFHGGDLQGVINKLDYLKELGVETLWLSPVFKMRTEKFFKYGAYHGYWTYDLTRVEPRFGDEALLRKLSDELHARKMKLVLDLVLNHVGPDAPLLAQKPEWFHRQGAISNWEDPVEVVNKDVHGLPDFAQEKEEVYRYLLSASLGWIDRVKPDGFRLDAVKHIPNSFWARFNADVKKHAGQDFILLGELLEGDAQKLATTWREGGFTHMFDFPLHFALVDVFCKGAPMSRLASTLSQDSLYPDPNRLVTLVDNHDLPRIASACPAEVTGTGRALPFIFFARGSPSITWGTEVALEGAKEPENRGDMRFDVNHPVYQQLKKLPKGSREHGSVLLTISTDSRHLALGWLAAPTGEELSEGGAVDVFNVSSEELNYMLPAALKPSLRIKGWEAMQRPPVGLGRYLVPNEPVLVLPESETVAYLDAVDSGRYAELHARAERQWLRPKSEIPVTFTAAAPIASGDALFVVGSSAELGAWNVAKAKGPFSDRALSMALAEGLAYEFKLLIRRKDGRTEWEPGDNRALFVPYDAGAMTVDLTWGKRNG